MATRPFSIDTNSDPALLTAQQRAGTQTIGNTSVIVANNTHTIDAGDNVVVVTTDQEVFVTVNEENFDQNFITNNVNNVGGGNEQVQYNANGNFAGDNTFTFSTITKVLSVSGLSTDTLLYSNGQPWDVGGGGSPGGANGELQFNDAGTFNGVPGVTWANAKLNLGVLSNLSISGGSSGQVLTTNGAGGLSWASPASSYSDANVAAYLPTYTGNVGANWLIADYVSGNANPLFHIPGANVVGTVANASYAANANYAAFANVAEFANNVAVEAVNNNYSYHVVLTTGPGDTTLHNDVDDNFQYNPADGILTVTRVDATYFVGDLAFAHGLPAANVTGLGNLATTNFNGNGQTWLSGNGTFANIAIPTVGNIASLNLDGSSSNVLYGNGVFAPVTGGGNLGNLQVTGTTVGIANGASETAIVIGANNSSLTLDTDSGVPVVNLQVQSTDSQYYEESFDYTSGTWVVNGLEGTLTITGYSPAFEVFLNSLGQYQSFTITVNGSETTATNGYSYGGGTVTFYTVLPPGVDPTNVSNIVFNTVFSNKLLMDPDEGDMGIYVGPFTLDLESQRDVRISAGDDFSIRANDGFEMRANSNFNIIANYANTQQNWSFLTTGNLDIPGNINFAGDPSAAPKLNNFFGVTSAVNFEITTNTAVSNLSWIFDNAGNLVLAGGNSVIQSIANSSLDPLIPNVSTMTLTPDANYNSQVLVLDPTAPGHIHLRAYAFSNIDEPAANIFLGGENTAFEITQGANNVAKIHSGGNTWTFNNDGTLQVAGGVFANTGASPAPALYGFSSLQVYDQINVGGIVITSADGTNGQVLTTYGNGVTYWSTVSGGGNGSPAGSNNQIQFNSNGAFGASGNYTFADTVGGGTVTVGNELVLLGNGTIGTANSNLNIQPAGNLIVTASAYNWKFDTAGNLTLPGNTFSVNYANGSQASAPLVDVLNTNGLTTVYYPTFVENRTTGQTVRADVDLSYRTDTNTLTVGNITVNSQSTLIGNSTTGANAVIAGITNTILPNSVAAFSANVNNYTQVTLQNKSTGADATADFVATADNGSDTVNFMDLGIINSGYDNNTPTNSLGNIVFAADSYLYAQGNVSNTSQAGGNLAIGTTVAGKTVKIFAGGTNSSSIVANIANTGITVTGNLSVSGNITGNTAGFALGYRDIPQIVASNATLAATDGGKHYYSTTAGNVTLTIPNNATTSFATGTAISIVVQAAGNILVNAAAGVTLYMAGNSTAANRVVGTYGMATLMKVASDTWFINGTGVS